MDLASVITRAAGIVHAHPEQMEATHLDGLMPGIPMWHQLRADVRDDQIHIWISASRCGLGDPWQVQAHAMINERRASTLLGELADHQMSQENYRALLLAAA